MTSTTEQPIPGLQPVSQISVPAEARALSSLARIDYADAFSVTTEVKLTPRAWVRAVLADAPPRVRRRLLLSWWALGLKLEPWSADRVLGWKVKHDGPSYLLLAADSWLGMRGELLFRSEPDGLLFATFVQQTNRAARALWFAVMRRHQDVVRSLLTHAATRARTSSEADTHRRR